jgi:hypothetical protein
MELCSGYGMKTQFQFEFQIWNVSLSNAQIDNIGIIWLN